MRTFLKKISGFFTPKYFAEKSKQPFRQSITFFSKTLILAFFIMGLLSLPTLLRLPGYFEQQMLKFNTFSLESNFSVVAPVYFPERDGFLIVDTTGFHKRMQHERFLITKEGLRYKLFKEENFIEADKFKNVLSNKENFGMLFQAITILLLPSLMFWAYALLWVKYFLAIFVLGTVFFILFDLTHYRKPWKQMLHLAAYSAAIPVLLETASLPFSTEYLMPLITIIGADIYAVPFIVHATLLVIITILVHYSER